MEGFFLKKGHVSQFSLTLHTPNVTTILTLISLERFVVEIKYNLLP